MVKLLVKQVPKSFLKWGISLKGSFYKENKQKTQSLKNSREALEWQKKKDDGDKLLLDPCVFLEYILGLKIIESTIKKQKKYSNNLL